MKRQPKARAHCIKSSTHQIFSASSLQPPLARIFFMRNSDEYEEHWFATLKRLKSHCAFQNSAACWVKLVQLAKGGGAKPPSDADIEKMAAEMAALPPSNGPARYGNVFSIREARDGQSGELQWSVRQPDLEILVARDSDDGMMQAIRWILKDSHSKNCMLCWRDFLRGQSKDHFGSHANSCDDPLILRFPAQASCFTDKYDDFWLMRLDAASKSARAGQAPAEAALFVHESPESGSIHLAHLPVLYDAQVFWQGVDHFCANLPAPDDEVDTLEVMQKNQALQFDLISTQIRTCGTFSKEFAIPLQGMNHWKSCLKKNVGRLKTACRIDGRRQWTSQRPLHRRHRTPRRLRLIGRIGWVGWIRRIYRTGRPRISIRAAVLRVGRSGQAHARHLLIAAYQLAASLQSPCAHCAYGGPGSSAIASANSRSQERTCPCSQGQIRLRRIRACAARQKSGTQQDDVQTSFDRRHPSLLFPLCITKNKQSTSVSKANFFCCPARIARIQAGF